MTPAEVLAAAQAELVATTAALAEMRRLRADRVDDDEHDPEGSTIAYERSQLDAVRRSALERAADAEAALARLADGTVDGHGLRLQQVAQRHDEGDVHDVPVTEARQLGEMVDNL